MKFSYFSKILCTLCILTSTVILSSASAELRLFSIGSGDLSGGYFATARAICEIFNASSDKPRRCSPEPTAGSIYNLSMLRAGELDFALVQSDWQRAAFQGTGPFAEFGAMENLRSVISLYPETITILAAPGSSIMKSADLAGKIVDIGRPASGRNATVRTMLEQMGLDTDFFGEIREYEAGYSVSELCSGRIDAAIFVVGHPNNFVAKTLEDCDASIIALAGPIVDRMEDEKRDYQKVNINLDLYGIEGDDVASLAVVATLVTRASIEQDLVADLIKAIRSNKESLMSSVTLLRNLDKYIEARHGMTAPQHPGAAEALTNTKTD